MTDQGLATIDPPVIAEPLTLSTDPPHTDVVPALGRRLPTWLRELVRRPTGVFGLITIGAVVFAALLSLVWTPFDPTFADPYQRWQGPTWTHWLGTDQLGRDVLSRLIAGSSTALLVAVGSLLIAAVVGLVLATLSALTVTWFREAVAVIVDVLIAFPTLLIAMLLAATLGGSLLVVVVSVGIASGVGISRIIKNEIVRVNSSDYVLAAHAGGVGPIRLIIDHLIPNVGALFIVLISTTAAFSILAEAGLSYLGYGAPSSVVSWGRMLAESQRYITTNPEAVIGPGIVISVVVLGLTLFGDALREATDPRLKRGRLRTPQEERQGGVTRGA